MVTGKERATLAGHVGWVAACAVSPDSTFVVTASTDHTGKIWEAATGKERATLAGHTGPVEACAISPDSTFVVTASNDNTCKIWEAATGKDRATLAGHTGPVEACEVSPDSAFVITASWDKTCKIWEAATGKERATLAGHTRRVSACAVSPDSAFVITASEDHTCKIWDAATGKERASLPLGGLGTCVALYPWQPVAVCGDEGGGVYLIDLVGTDYGPIVVTVVDTDSGAGPTLRCPKCLQFHPLNDAWLGEVIMCPTPDCGLSLRVNPFVTRMATRRSRRGWRR